ncbi:unnamed protein product [Vitrella brassicaformis CCMP3155]|uniref:Pre-mRNA-splicing factor SYF1 n=2 Tax=Vitrella brassicaformis TaxID=1169539 RepID=A0A0G4EVT4_VITBC|nr:unnamed protein product [Vitrella brassicaformis CCMP3155]|eukprot:CEM02311.1 unnamed protein product [Vitrella brassicaformis CCMP3155]
MAAFSSVWGSLADDIIKETDVAYEEELTRNPYSVKVWWAYLNSKTRAPPKLRNFYYERALQSLPGSYKLWRVYLGERMEQVKANCITDPGYERVNVCFERALVFLNKMPKIWIEYTDFLRKQKLVTRTRRTYDRALRALPITQHDRIWERYIDFIKDVGVIESAVCVFRRYLMLEPDHIETYIAYLISVGHFDEAARLLAKVVNDEGFTSMEGKTNHQLWMDLCDLITKHPKEIKSLAIEPVIRSGLKRFTDEVGRLWCSLADHFIRLGHLEKARDVYEEALCEVTTMHDFALVFDAYTNFEEALITNKVDSDPQDSEQQDGGAGEEVDFLMARLDHLLAKRPELVSSVKLRQNPHSVHEWLNRVKIYHEEPERVIRAFTEAVMTIDPQRAVGKLHLLWIRFAGYYETHDDLDNARVILEKATHVNFRGVDDLATIWCHWAEMEIKHKHFDKALEVARQAINRPRNAPKDSVQARLYRSVKVWALCADLEENFGTLETTRACYDKMIELKVATPQLIINYAHYLEEMRFYEESFRVYEKGVNLFKWPHVHDIWLFYLTKFVARYGGKKLERARDLFEQAVSDAPPKYSKGLYLLYARLEEEYGLARHALALYERACLSAAKADKYTLYLLYIAKTAELFGVTKTRKIYEKAVEELEDKEVIMMCLKFATLEKSLGEIDRAREIYKHTSQFCDPRKEAEFWKEWREFEVAHGNEDTFRDMLRVKRSVQAIYAQVHFNVADIVAEAAPQLPLDPMAAAEAELKQQEEVKRRRAEEADFEVQKKRKTQEEADIAAAQEEYRKLQEKRRVDEAKRAVAGGPPFIQTDAFQGGRLGYIFKMGPHGLGYYRDAAMVGEEAAEQPPAPTAPTKPKPTGEEIDIEMDLEASVPAEVFGSLGEQAAEQKAIERELEKEAKKRLDKEEKERLAEQEREKQREKMMGGAGAGGGKGGPGGQGALARLRAGQSGRGDAD